LAQSRFLTHTLVLLAAAVIPVFTATFAKLHTDTAYSASSATPTNSRVTMSQADSLMLTQGGFIMKVSAATTDSPVRRDVTYYTMKPGDTLVDVAGMFGLTPDTLRWANNIADVTSVVAGQKLVIPPVNGVLVRVQPGMQLNGLASKYHVQVQDIIDFNLLRDPDHLQPGSFLMLPDGVGPPSPSLARRFGPNVVWTRFGNQSITYYPGAVSGSGGHFPYGYCTWWVAHKRFVPWSGDAWMWWYNARQFGFPEGQYPKPGAIMVVGISWGSPIGHVAYVESVNADGSFVVSEMNYGRWGVVDYRVIRSTAGQDILGFIY
jgi:surface antigen/LysM repeat protein